MGFKIGSFNMYKFSDQSNNKNLEKIAEIILEEQFDIIAIQEVFSKSAVQSLIKHLFGWDFRWAKPTKSSSSSAEGYAFIWNAKRFKLSYNEENGIRKNFEPRILNQYRVNKSDGQSELIRNPYFGRFTTSGCPGGCFVEIRLINAHINFGKKEIDNESVEEPGAIKQRNKEYEVLAKAIYPKYADRRYGNNMPAYTVILGDYNLNLRNSKCKSAILKHESVWLKDNQSTKIIQTFQQELSSLSDKDIEENDHNENSLYANNYDHFSFDILTFNEDNINVNVGRVDAVRKYYNCERDKYKVEVSDHIPVYMTIDF